MIRELKQRFDVVSSRVQAGSKTFDILHPRNADDLISEEEYVLDQRLPYWASIWPPSTILATYLGTHPPTNGRSALELGCGLGVVTTAAMSAGYDVIASDYYADALVFARANSFLNLGRSAEARLIDWHDFPVEMRNFDLIMASDVLYELEYATLLASIVATALAPQGIALIADPGRIATEDFLKCCTTMGLRLQNEETFEHKEAGMKYPIKIHTIVRGGSA